MNHILEICCGEIAAVEAALEGGARRIELCSGLEEGGMTPSCALIREAAATGMPEINVLIRPRPGDFLFQEREVRIMEEDIRLALDSGATGVAIGALDADGDIDIATCRRLVSAAKETAARLRHPAPNITFHRAFDVCRDPRAALEDVIALGCDCLLTSGMETTAEKGIGMLRQLSEQASGRIKIIAGAGVHPGNAARIMEQTGVDGVHSTARRMMQSRMRYRAERVSFGEDRLVTSPDIVRKL